MADPNRYGQEMTAKGEAANLGTKRKAKRQKQGVDGGMARVRNSGVARGREVPVLAASLVEKGGSPTPMGWAAECSAKWQGLVWPNEGWGSTEEMVRPTCKAGQQRILLDKGGARP